MSGKKDKTPPFRAGRHEKIKRRQVLRLCAVTHKEKVLPGCGPSEVVRRPEALGRRQQAHALVAAVLHFSVAFAIVVVVVVVTVQLGLCLFKLALANPERGAWWR